jgi:iron complex outermembrane receptor protein
MIQTGTDTQKAAKCCLFSSRQVLSALFACLPWAVLAQMAIPTTDTVTALGDIVVKGFGSGQSRLSVPASVTVLKSGDLSRFSATNLVPVMNTVPGVRMEERSPGSYRLTMRGSPIRSPFGIRNVKVYLGDMILTDAGGNTYLNLLDINMLGAVEIIRGPAGSMYGSGTSGVVHLSAQQRSDGTSHEQGRGMLQIAAGSYGQYAHALNWRSEGTRSQLTVSQGTYLSEGYRRNSRMRRDAFQADWSARSVKGHAFQGFLLLSDLSYRTPGGLTLPQQMVDPRQARPATPTIASAEAQRTGIRNGTVLTGLSVDHRLAERLHWRNAVTLSLTDFSNPFFTNYEKRRESNLGFRSVIDLRRDWRKSGLSWLTGLEWQRGDYDIDSSGNQGGIPDARNVRDAVRALQGFVFTQGELRLPGNLRFQAGLSLNRFTYHLERTQGQPSFPVSGIGFDVQPAPRFAALWKPFRTLSLHASLARGFSPPSLAEVKPSAGGFATGLQAENGWSREVGLKGSVWRNRIQFDAALFDFRLMDAIVRRTNPAGAEFFVNAGDIRQRGAELFLEGFPVQRPSGAIFRQIRLWTSLTRYRFRFGDYISAGQSLLGNRLTGVPDAMTTAGADITLSPGFYLLITRYRCGSMPLTDVNDAFAEAYALWHARVGWKTTMGGMPVECYLSGENLSNTLYSSGNDLNAFGRRYYNPSPGRSFLLGLKLAF